MSREKGDICGELISMHKAIKNSHLDNEVLEMQVRPSAKCSGPVKMLLAETPPKNSMG